MTAVTAVRAAGTRAKGDDCVAVVWPQEVDEKNKQNP
jgi:hypothetical protein